LWGALNGNLKDVVNVKSKTLKEYDCATGLKYSVNASEYTSKKHSKWVHEIELSHMRFNKGYKQGEGEKKREVG